MIKIKYEKPKIYDTGGIKHKNPFTRTTCVVIVSSLRRGETHEQISAVLNRDYDDYMKQLQECIDNGMIDLATEDIDNYGRLKDKKVLSWR